MVAAFSEALQGRYTLARELGRGGMATVYLAHHFFEEGIMTATTQLPAAQLLYADFDHEFSTTRRFLERFPVGKGAWRPHEKSRPLGALATHVAAIPDRGRVILETEELDVGTLRPRPELESGEELVGFFDTNVAGLRAALASADLAALERLWTFRAGGQVLVQLPKRQLLRTMMMSHLIHHRAQLGVYYRLLGVPVPGAYGPTADEGR